MNILIRDTICTKLPEYAGVTDVLSFLKYSTPNSGKHSNDKIIFLVFKEGATEPSLCVKTVRSYGAKEAILRNFDILKKLHQLAAESPYASLFAQPLFLHDDGEHVFSVETACRGRKMKFDAGTLQKVVEMYTSFHTHLAKRMPRNSLRQFAHEVISTSNLLDAEQEELLQFARSLPGLSVTLPRILQHGDLTEDNILVSEDGFCIVDCDFAGVTDLPGFDLFGLFYRHDRRKAREQSVTALRDYFNCIGAEVHKETYETLFFLYYLIERLRKSAGEQGQSAAQLIAGFNRFFV